VPRRRQLGADRDPRAAPEREPPRLRGVASIPGRQLRCRRPGGPAGRSRRARLGRGGDLERLVRGERRGRRRPLVRLLPALRSRCGLAGRRRAAARRWRGDQLVAEVTELVAS
jgi:hypothetical protein